MQEHRGYVIHNNASYASFSVTNASPVIAADSVNRNKVGSLSLAGGIREPLMNKELRDALNRLKGKPMPAAEFEAQRLSFVYGNAAKEDKGTKEDVRRSLTEANYALHP